MLLASGPSRGSIMLLLLLMGCVYLWMLSANINQTWNIHEAKLRGFHQARGSDELVINQTVESTKHFGQFGFADAQHSHGIWLGYDEGVPLWTPTPLLTPVEQWTDAAVQVAYEHYGFNTNMTNSLPLDRQPEDFRDAGCQRNYDISDFTAVSIIMTFYNEDLSVLLRTLHSLLNTVPVSLLGEIILIDDGSNSTTHPWLFDQLDDYIRRGLPKVRLSRFHKRHGLMRGRMHGANLARFDNLVFFDTHIECGPNWLSPLLARLAADYRNVACPVIESLGADDFKRNALGIDTLGFTWVLGQASDHSLIGNRNVSRTEPSKTPIMAGGLFAITARWFSELGQYDKLLQNWGGEEMELSFKTWQCGGQLESLPCSRVAHVFRSTKHTKTVSYLDGSSISRNRLRVASVWMDAIHLKITQIGLAPLDKGTDIGDLTQARKIRENLQCHNFAWYLANVYPELYVPDLSTSKFGALRILNGNQCLDNYAAKAMGKTLGVYTCHGQHGTQAFLFTKEGHLRLANEFSFDMCASLQEIDGVQVLSTAWCASSSPWTLDDQGKMKQGSNCLAISDSKLRAVSCEDASALRWEWV